MRPQPILFGFLFIICSIGLAQPIRPHSHKTVRFVENKGQWEENVMYRTDLPGGKLFIEGNKLTYNFYDTKFLANLHDHKNHQHERGDHINNNMMMPFHAFAIDFIGSSENPKVTSSNPNTERNNYYLGNDPSKWASNVRSFEKINYENIYPNINLAVYESQQTLKYEFVVAPGVDPSIIKMRYTGASSLTIDHGNLHIKTTVNEITEDPPYIYQTIEGKEVQIKGKFIVQDSIVSFSIGSYNKEYPLIIDPKLIFSTYSGSTGDNWGNTAAFDEFENMYSGGTVFHVGFPTTLGAFQVNFAGGPFSYGWGIDVGILKYNPSGTGLLYATYLGGTYSDVPYSLVVDNNDNLVIFGSTSSNNFPTTLGAFDNTFNGGSNISPISGINFWLGTDLFITKISSDGSTLMGSTLIGGSANDGILLESETLTKNYGDQLRGDVTVDGLNNIYVASNTRSLNFPFSAGASQTTYNGGFVDAVVFKLRADLTNIIWSTYLGGSGDDAAYSIQVDSLYNVFVAGGTTSSNFPTTSGVIHQTYQGGIDGFITHINQFGTAIIESSYVGTSSYDQVYFVQLDSIENVYLLGQTRGIYPITPGAYNNPNSGQFLHKLSRDLSASLMSTVIGSGGNNPNISLTAFLVNECGNIFLSGWGGANNSGSFYVGGNTNNMPLTIDAYQSTTDGSDFYIMALAKNASALLYATYFGGIGEDEHVDGGTSRFDKKGIIYQSVCAGCGGTSLFPTYPNPGAWSNTNQSAFWEGGFLYNNCNNGSFKFDLANLKADFTIAKSIDCGNTLVTLTNTSIGGKSFFWALQDNFTSTSPGPIQHVYSNPGDYTITLIATDLTTCIGRDTISKLVSIPPPPTLVFNTADTTICKGDSVALAATNNPSFTYQWSPPDFLSSTTIANPIASPDKTYTYTVTVTDTNNCIVTKKIIVEVVDPKKGFTFAAHPDCEGKIKVSLSNVNVGRTLIYHWLFSDGFTTTTPSNYVVHEYKDPEGPQTVYLDIESNGCSIQDTFQFELEKVFIPNLITPNKDGHNETFAIQGIGEDWTVELYNRWGKRIYKNTNYQNEWTGEEFSDDVYYFLIISPNEKRCKGWVQIIR